MKIDQNKSLAAFEIRFWAQAILWKSKIEETKSTWTTPRLPGTQSVAVPRLAGGAHGSSLSYCGTVSSGTEK
jgi:hypothetical protein